MSSARSALNVAVTTADGSYGLKGFVNAAMEYADYTYFYTCGPKPMLKAVNAAAKTSGQFSFEERMAAARAPVWAAPAKQKMVLSAFAPKVPCF